MRTATLTAGRIARSRSGRRRSGGFTLVEIILVLTLLGLLAAAAFGGIRTITRASQAGEAMIDRNSNLRAAQEFLRRQISQTLATRYAQKDGTGEPIMFEGKHDRMTFVAPMPGYLGHGGAYVQELAFERGRDGTALVLRFAILNGYRHDKKGVHSGKPTPIFEAVERGRFQYRGLNDQGELDRWQDDWKIAGRLPVLIKVQLDPPRDSPEVWPEMVIPLLVDASAGASTGGPDFGPLPPPVQGGKP